MTERISRNPGRRRLPVRLACLLLPAALLAACAMPPQQPGQPTPVIGGTPAAPGSAQQQALRAIAEAQSRIDRVAGPLLVNNAPLCKSHAYKLLGFAAKNKYSYSADLAETVQQTFGYGERLQVTNVLAGSGAERVGVRRGDILIAADNKELPPGDQAERQAAAVLAPLVRSRSLVKLTVERNDARQSLTVPLTQSCGFSIDLGNADHVNAYADGRRIVITRGLLNFARSDQELGYVIAREMAHNILGHAARQRLGATMGGIIDNLIRVNPDLDTMTGRSGVTPYPATLDAEADRLGLYLAARAGYDASAAAAFWRGLAERTPASVANGYTAIHPDSEARLAALEKAAAEIRSKQAAKRPLLP
ncbi:M48 family metallopeptidase [Noviherbaspirillum sedimenti]|uniref:Peptidase M48 n=1 Tax=Noviherbaspirillum sedimenti TaxID=2320865 RepID=A0A3A3G290_9BURK|nr:M48 family metallopeptidase [Noviherbaspirillum sedimenti]RJG01775.1 peptidase M48 [Noviherbaspirillum sedimenti]